MVFKGINVYAESHTSVSLRSLTKYWACKCRRGWCLYWPLCRKSWAQQCGGSHDSSVIKMAFCDWRQGNPYTPRPFFTP